VLQDRDEEEDDLAAIAAQLNVPVDAVPEMLADDRVDDADAVVIDEDGEAVVPGALLKSGTIDTYIAAVAELHRSQYSAGSNKEPILRGAALKALLESHKQSQGTRNRAAFVDRGANGISAGYTDVEFLRLQELLLQGSDKNPLVSQSLFIIPLLTILY
jgi:hypothetical protein